MQSDAAGAIERCGANGHGWRREDAIGAVCGWRGRRQWELAGGGGEVRAWLRRPREEARKRRLPEAAGMARETDAEQGAAGEAESATERWRVSG